MSDRLHKKRGLATTNAVQMHNRCVIEWQVMTQKLSKKGACTWQTPKGLTGLQDFSCFQQF